VVIMVLIQFVINRNQLDHEECSIHVDLIPQLGSCIVLPMSARKVIKKHNNYTYYLVKGIQYWLEEIDNTVSFPKKSMVIIDLKPLQKEEEAFIVWKSLEYEEYGR